MYGAILGDMIGAPYEFDRGNKTKDFPLFTDESQFTDDTVMSLAVALALISVPTDADEATVKSLLIDTMVMLGKRYPSAGYGSAFSMWLRQSNPQPYDSYGNGSAMRVSAVPYLYDSLERVLEVSAWTAQISHNHPEGVRGAQAVAGSIWMARQGASKKEIKHFVESYCGYDLSRTCDDIRPTYYHDESCQRTVPEAITAYLEGTSFEDVIRTAVSLGGDCDTLTCIAGSIAEATYPIPQEMKKECIARLTPDLLDILYKYIEKVKEK